MQKTGVEKGGGVGQMLTELTMTKGGGWVGEMLTMGDKEGRGGGWGYADNGCERGRGGLDPLFWTDIFCE